MIVLGLLGASGCADLLELDDYQPSGAQATGGQGVGGFGGSRASGGVGGAGGAAGNCTLDYQQRIIDDGAISYWRLGEARGPTAESLVGRYPASYVGGMLSLPGAEGAIACDTAVQFQAGCLDADSIHNFAGTSTFSIEVWIRFDVQLPNDATVVGFRDTYGWRMIAKLNGQVWFERHTMEPSYAETGVPPNAGAVGTYHHLVGTYDGVELRLYRDGVLADKKPSADEIIAQGSQFVIGGGADCLGDFFRGYIDEVAVYDRVLEEDTVAAHYDLGTPR
jgi:hypothetical protein